MDTLSNKRNDMSSKTFVVFFPLISMFLCSDLKVITTKTGPVHGKVVACIWETWSIYRPDRGKFQLENINPSFCTHLIFAFTTLDDEDDSIKFLGKWTHLDLDKNNKNNITKMKEKYPHIKILVAVGGWKDGSVKYSKLAADAQRRSNFVNNTIEFIIKHNFDGLDLVWTFPGKRGGGMHDKINFVELVKDLRKEYVKNNLLLTAALGGSKDTIDNGYDIPELSAHLDFLFVMSYDYYGWWSPRTGASAPLYGPDLLTVDYSIKHLFKLKVDRKKLILGLPFYGRTFILTEPVNSSVPPSLNGHKLKEDTFGGPYTQEKGAMYYNEICLELFTRKSEWSLYWDTESRTSYAINKDKLISYDNDRSLSEKIKYAMYNGLGGVMAWPLDGDDFQGDCYETIDDHRDFPLLRMVDRELNEFSKYEEYSQNLVSPLSICSPAVHLEVNYFVFFATMLLFYSYI